MKILLSFPQKDGQTGLFIKRAFTDLGCELRVHEPRVNTNSLYDMAKNFKPDALFCSRTPDLLNVIKRIKKDFPDITLACWNVDKRDDVMGFGGQLMGLFKQMDLMYTIAKGNIAQYEKHCPGTKVKHLQQGCDPITHFVEELSEQDHKKYDCDIMFAGNICGCHTGRERLLKKIQTLGVNYHRYTNVFDSEHNKACLGAKIVLGHNAWPKVAISSSVRDYKVMGAGGFLLTQYSKELETWYDEGMCEWYKSDEECLDKIKYYLAHDDERKKIAEKGYIITHEKHKYIDRMKIVLDDFKVNRHE
jgi:hypothetical protein